MSPEAIKVYAHMKVVFGPRRGIRVRQGRRGGPVEAIIEEPILSTGHKAVGTAAFDGFLIRNAVDPDGHVREAAERALAAWRLKYGAAVAQMAGTES